MTNVTDLAAARLKKKQAENGSASPKMPWMKEPPANARSAPPSGHETGLRQKLGHRLSGIRTLALGLEAAAYQQQPPGAFDTPAGRDQIIAAFLLAFKHFALGTLTPERVEALSADANLILKAEMEDGGTPPEEIRRLLALLTVLPQALEDPPQEDPPVPENTVEIPFVRPKE